MRKVCVELGLSFEILVIDDGSKDGTWAAVVAENRRDPRVWGVKLSRNYGHQVALSAGLQHCRGDDILIIDADLQDPPELLGDMLNLRREGAEVVYGVRRRRDGERGLKLLTAFLFYRVLSSLSDVPIPMDAGDFRLMSRKALDAFLSMPEQHRFVRGMVAWLGFRQVPILYDRQARHAGVSKYPLWKMWRFALNAITSFSIQPLKLASLLGLSMAFLAACGVVYTVIGYFLGHTIAGWASLIVVMLSIGSLQFLVLGIMGEYLGRLCLESKRRPLYVIDTQTQR